MKCPIKSCSHYLHFVFVVVSQTDIKHVKVVTKPINTDPLILHANQESLSLYSRFTAHCRLDAERGDPVPAKSDLTLAEHT